MKLSITLPAVYTAQNISLAEAYRALRSCGFTRVSITAAAVQQGDDFKAHCGAAIAAGMTVTSVRVEGNPFESDEAMAFIKSAVERAGQYGIDTAIIPLGTEINIGHYDYLDRNENYLKGVLTIAENKGTHLLFENAGSYQIAHYTHHAREIRLLTDRVPHPLLGVNVNVGNLGLSDIQPYPQIKLLGDLVKGVDMSDNFGAMPLAVHPERQDFQMLPLMGSIDFDQVMQSLTEIGFDGVCNLTVNIPKAPYIRYESTGRPKFSLGITNRLYTWAFHVMRRMLESYNAYEEN